MPRTDTSKAAFEMPATIAGLWGLCALAPFRSRSAYEDAAALCSKFAVRRLTAVQREYFRELQALVESYEDQHGEDSKTLAQLRSLAVS